MNLITVQALAVPFASHSRAAYPKSPQNKQHSSARLKTRKAPTLIDCLIFKERRRFSDEAAHYTGHFHMVKSFLWEKSVRANRTGVSIRSA
jgi:hypothetical protein